MFEMIIAFAVGIIILCLIAKIISLPVKLLFGADLGGGGARRQRIPRWPGL